MMTCTKSVWQVGKLTLIDFKATLLMVLLKMTYYMLLKIFVNIFLLIGALALELDIWTTYSADTDFTLESGSRFEVRFDEL